MTAKTSLKKTQIEEIVEWFKRMHCFHPGRYYAVVTAISAAVAALAGLLIAIPFLM